MTRFEAKDLLEGLRDHQSRQLGRVLALRTPLTHWERHEGGRGTGETDSHNSPGIGTFSAGPVQSIMELCEPRWRAPNVRGHA
jgi:hypothetical protein